MQSNMQVVDPSVLRMIESNFERKEKFLDLGNCGLTDDFFIQEPLIKHIHLEGINLGRYYYKNGSPIHSDNKLETNNSKSDFSETKSSANVLTEIPFNLPKGIKELYLNKISLTDITNINLYPNLVSFDAYGNNIKSVNSIEIQTNMLSFGISNNQLENIDFIKAFPNLVSLYAGENQINKIGLDFINHFKKLEILHLYNNNLDDLLFIEGNEIIQQLFLSRNKIREVDFLKDSIYLKIIDLTQNPITTKIPREVIDTKDALSIRLFLRNISLPQLLIEESILKKDDFLDLGNCGLNDNSAELALLKTCTHLKSLSLGNGYFRESTTYIPSANTGKSNRFTSIPVAALPDNLKYLQMRGTNVNSILIDIHLKKLVLLDLSFNLIAELNNLEDLGNLKELALHGNQIKTIGNSKFPPNLEILHLSSNAIKSLNGIERCLQLKQLVLFDNEITEIKPLVSLKKIELLNLNGNPIVDCPSDIWTSNSIHQIAAYFKEIDTLSISKSIIPANDSFTDYNDVKLIILGNSNTGKTHLVHFLETGKFLNERNSTHGLDVRRWRPDAIRFPQLANVEVSIWDFGGQEYYHEAYKLFLGNDAVYIVLWSSDSDAIGKQEEYLIDKGDKVLIDHFDKTYWLDTLKYFKGDSENTPIVLVQNKVDEDSQKERVSQELHKEYQINESFHISIKEGAEKGGQKQRNLNNFADYLADTLAGLANKAQLPPACKKVRNELLHYKESIFSKEIEDDFYLELDKFYNVCMASEEIVSENFHHFPEWLNKGGSLVYFEKNIKLNQYIFISPSLLSQNIYAILNKEILNCNGELAIVERNKKDDITINAMKSFGLLYEHPTKPKTHYLAPQYLPEDHPIEDLFKIASANAWENSFWIKVPMFFYKRLMHWLLLYFIKDVNSTARYFWKNGIIILRNIDGKNDLKILIKGLYTKDNISLNKKEGIIQVSVEGADKNIQKEIFSAILKFKDVDEDIEAISPPIIKTVEEIPKKQLFFLDKLELSIDKINFEKYNVLKGFYENPQSDIYNSLIKYKAIVPFDIKGIEPKNIFVSYSHNNTVWLNKIRNHLAGLRRSNYIKDWTDKEIVAGEMWDNKIQEQMNKADIFILLLSADFIASDYIWNIELKKAFEKRNPPPKIIPIYLESCDLAATPSIIDLRINDFEIIPKDANGILKPINLWTNEAEALSKVATDIRRAILETTV